MALNKQLVACSLTAAVLCLAYLSSSARALDPMIDTGVSALSPDGKHVSVHVPAFFDLRIDTRGPAGSRAGLRMSQSVLSGLVRIFVDRARDTNGVMQGPIDVKVFGQTIYSNQAPPLSSNVVVPTVPEALN